MLGLLDTVFCDLKALDPELHRRATGCGNRTILDNIRRLGEGRAAGRQVILRIPVIPGFNDNEQELSRMADFIRALPYSPQVELLPFHGLCSACLLYTSNCCKRIFLIISHVYNLRNPHLKNSTSCLPIIFEIFWLIC